ncbi:MAG: outer membrane protein transport protein [Gammaproteobacteria bacterium]|nr:outer membrane protein transport protein [Gammaproteobacteria bacterium]
MAYSAVYQILNDYFYPNPAELITVKDTQLVLGNVYAVPSFEFSGETSIGEGKATSRANNSLPYLLAAHRFTDKFVLGLNITPSGYGHIAWPEDSIVANLSTQTEILYYQIGLQSVYQFNDRLAIGVGFNVEYNKFANINYVVPPLGNQVNKITNGINYVGDVGAFYKINAYNYLTTAVYTQVSTYGHGFSTLGPLVSNDFSLNVLQALIAYVGLQHTITEKLSLEEKIYFSGWGIGKNVDLINTATGSNSTPANWGDAWSFQVSASYALKEKLALLGSGIYETNPVPVATNQIGYPVSSSGALSIGLDLSFMKEFSVQAMYSYGAFLPNATIANITGHGTVAANFQSGVVQFIYKT